MADIGADEASLVVRRWVCGSVAAPGGLLIVVIVAPFGEMIGKFEARGVGRCILKINDDKLLVGVGREQEG